MHIITNLKLNNTMEKITYIIPIHQFDESIEKYLLRALESLKSLRNTETFKVMFVGSKDILINCEKLYKNVGCTQKLDLFEIEENNLYIKINQAVSKCVTSYFSILELDDKYYEYWNDVAQNVIKKHNYSIIMPINEIVNTDGNIVSLMNEIAWDAAFTDELGFIGHEELKVFKDFNVTGAYIKTDDFISCGMLKPSMKIAAWYEFLLRMVNCGYKIFISPRIGYQHTYLREGSYMLTSQKEISIEEGKWLIEYAINDYVNKIDTNKKFEK